MTSRRNVLIRTSASAIGDIAAGAAIASACIWLIETAALGLFLSFLVWLIGAFLYRAVSQRLVHPTVATVLTSNRLDRGMNALASRADQTMLAGHSLWHRRLPAI